MIATQGQFRTIIALNDMAAVVDKMGELSGLSLADKLILKRLAGELRDATFEIGPQAEHERRGREHAAMEGRLRS
jgi:hypothetical protein